MLPQGFKNSPALFGNQLSKDLEQWEHPPGAGTILQYVEDLLVATETKELNIMWTVSLLNFLGLSGYQVSPQKAQVAQQQVMYLGYEIKAGVRTLGTAREEAICQTPKPQTSKELRTFLGMTDWCCLRIYNYGLLIKLFYELLKSSPKDLTQNGKLIKLSVN